MKIKTLLGATVALLITFTLIVVCVFTFWPERTAALTGIGPLDRSRLGMLCAALVAVIMMIGWLVEKIFERVGKAGVHIQWSRYPAKNIADPPRDPGLAESAGWRPEELSALLCFSYGRFWRARVRFALLIGDEALIEQIAPGLTTQRWLAGDGLVLFCGGTADAPIDQRLLLALRQLHRRKPLDAIIQIVPAANIPGAAALDETLRQRHDAQAALGWQIPVYLWMLDATPDYAQSGRETQPIGALLPAGVNAAVAFSALQDLISPLREHGVAQLLLNNRHDYLLRLSEQLAGEWGKNLLAMLTFLLRGPCALLLRGIMFSQPITVQGTVANAWLAAPEWLAITEDCRKISGRRIGRPWFWRMRVALLTLAVFWGIGTLLSLFVNASLANDLQKVSLAAADTRQPLALRLRYQLTLQQHMEKLQYRQQAGAPWYSRFGLNQNAAQLAMLWPLYQHNSEALIRDAAGARLHQLLTAFVQLPPGSQQRGALTQAAYDQLKAYLMLARPDKTEAFFFSKTVMANWPRREDTPAGQWQRDGPKLLTFWAGHLPAHPHWKMTPDRQLITAVRQVLLKQIGQRHAEASLYQNMLKSVANNYPDMALAHMVGDTDPQTLFRSEERVPGMFTRQAWEEQVKEAIEQVVMARREEIDWVLTSKSQPSYADISPEVLQERLTKRYFADFGNAWLNMVSSLRWHEARSLSEAIAQLSLMADVRQSPLVALMNTLAWQGKTGQRGDGFADNLVDSTKNLLQGNKSRSAINQTKGPKGPLDSSFGPLLRLMASQDGAGGNGRLDFQSYLTRVTQVRLKLQQITSAPDPQAMTWVLAQAVFQGKAVDLADTRDYGGLVAASLGQEWNGFGQTVFVQPLELAWRQVLQPAAGSLNAQWQKAIVNQWNTSFAGRYPFSATGSDASLPLLASYLRNDSGLIATFLKTRLGGILQQEGNRWAIDPLTTQGLKVNPAFLHKINQLAELAEIAFAQGDAGLRFELLARPSRDVARTQFQLDEQSKDYFNQMESWQSFRWPGNTYYPGARLSWRSVTTGMRLFADHQGNWGLIRLLDSAQVTQLDSSRYQLIWQTPDGGALKYVLRSELNEGPLALLRLRNFRLPEHIFLLGP